MSHQVLLNIDKSFSNTRHASLNILKVNIHILLINTILFNTTYIIKHMKIVLVDPLMAFFSTHNVFIIVIFLLITITPSTSDAAQTYTTETLAVENRSPIMQLFSLSRPEYFTDYKPASVVWQPKFEIINYISATRKSNDTFFIDGESLIVSNTFQYQLSDNSQLHFLIPWISHSGGTADRFIYNFHDAFQLPQNGRSLEQNNRMLWFLSSNNEEVLNFQNNSSGIGDIQLKYIWTPEAGNLFEDKVQLSTLLKLPSGSFDKQTGSGNVDLGISAIHTNPAWFKERRFLSEITLSFWYGAGINYIGRSSGLKLLDRNPFALTFRSGLAWKLSPTWQLKIQSDTSSPLFKTEIRELGWFPLQLTLASSHTINKRTKIDFTLAEDLRPRSAPDVIFSAGMSLQL